MTFEWRTMMKDAISDVMEKMFFSLMDFEEMPAAGTTHEHASSIALTCGNRRIIFSFLLLDGFARSITANLLGLDESEVTGEEIEDTMRETANMIGGDFQARLGAEPWQLEIPQNVPGEGTIRETDDGLSFGTFGDHAGVVLFRMETSDRG